jgi:hypothetical protein
VKVSELTTPEAVERGRLAIERQKRFALKHPEIDIRVELGNDGPVFRVAEPGRDAAEWSDPNEMMDDLEGRYPE